MKLQDKVAIVTGAASGMGKTIAELYAKESAKVIIADYHLEGAKAVSEEIVQNGGTSLAIKADVSKLEDVENMIQTAINEYGTLDILANMRELWTALNLLEKLQTKNGIAFLIST